ncbi:MAG: TRAP transporter large permease [Candidatus Limivicinus sp.]|nr:TRAP transporter large permease [Candidatus Limivicinus sp.]
MLQMTLVGLVLFLVVIVIGVPIAFAMGAITIVGLSTLGTNLITLPQKMFAGIDTFTYLCIPLFILASEIMSRCGLLQSIVDFCDSMVGHIRGGLAHVNVMASMLFAGVSGSATADATGLGKIEMEMMTRAGYKKEYAATVTAASAIIGPIIPPSNIMIIYAVCAGNVSVSNMFLGGLLPGIILGLAEMGLCYYYAVKYNHPRNPKPTWRQRGKIFWRALPALGLPVIILGGIVTGAFTATESSAIAVFYALLVAIFRRSITFKSFLDCCKGAAKSTAAVMVIIAVASAMGYTVTVLRIPQTMVEFFMNYIGNKYVFLLFVNILLLILGMVMDQSPALLIMVPILLPIANAFDIDPLHFGLVCCFNLTIGLITPPVGMTLFVTSNVAKVKLTDLFKGILPYCVVGIAVLILLTWVPGIVTFIPNLVS